VRDNAIREKRSLSLGQKRRKDDPLGLSRQQGGGNQGKRPQSQACFNKKKMTNEELAYIAGIIDGEGCVGLYRSSSKWTGRVYKGKRYERGNTSRIAINVQVVMTNKEVISFLHKTTGLGSMRPAKTLGNRKRAWIWQVRARQAYSLLGLVMPHLIAKKPQGEIALRFEKTIGWHGNRGLPDNIKKEREKLFNNMSKLNQRGLRK